MSLKKLISCSLLAAFSSGTYAYDVSDFERGYYAGVSNCDSRSIFQCVTQSVLGIKDGNGRTLELARNQFLINCRKNNSVSACNEYLSQAVCAEVERQ